MMNSSPISEVTPRHRLDVKQFIDNAGKMCYTLSRRGKFSFVRMS